MNSVRHAQAQGLARRIQSAAKLRARHRAGANIKQTTTQNHEKSSENNGPKPFKNQPQIDQKSIENQPTIHPKSIKNQPKIDQKSTRSEKCRALRLGSRLGGVLEASWRSLRGQHSSKLASQIEGKSIKNQCKNRSKNRCLLSSSFDAILIDFRREIGGMFGTKIESKSDVKIERQILQKG